MDQDLGSRPGTPHPIHEKALIVVFEQGAASAEQATALVQWFRQAGANFPGIKVVTQFVN